MMESICTDTIMTAWESLQDTMFAMWKNLSAIGYIFFGLLVILVLLNIALTIRVAFPPPNQEGKEG